jgi:HEAT repeat protein
VPALIAALGDANGLFVRQSAAVALERIGPAAAEAVPALIQALGDADENVRAKAAVALGRIGPAAAEAVPALIQALGDADENVRAKGAVALGGIGPAAAEAVPALIAALGDANENIRESAAWALGKIGPAAAEAVPALIAALGDTDKDVRAKAIAALRWIGPAAVPALIQALSSADENVRANAVRALEKRRLASPDRSPTTAAEAVVEAVLMLIAALGDADKDVRANAAKALTAIEPMAAAVRQSTAEATAAPRGTTVVPGAEPVDTAVFCPPRVKKESVFLVQVFLYPPGAEDKVDDQARKMDEAAEHRGTYSLPLDLPPNTRVDLRLEIPNLTVTEADAVLVWRGRPTAAQFEVTVPAAAPGTEAIGRVRFAVAGVPAGTIRFKVALAASGTLERAALPEVEAVRYRRAFVSYSSQDRAEVLRRVQAFRIAGLSVFQDILDLEPGERWARALYREIDKCDVFLLFWSRAAAASEWVAREIAYALKVKAGNDDRPPAIQPVPIEGPPPPPAPETLRHLHFNDALLAHIQAADARPVSNGG